MLSVPNAADFGDWQDSKTWATVSSDTLVISPKTSTVNYSYMVDGIRDTA